MKNRFVVLLAVLLLCLIVFPVHLLYSGESVAKSGASWINIALSGIPQTLIPWEVTDAVSLSICMSNVYETLFTYDNDRTQIIPWLAVDYRIKNAGQVWVFTLRSGVRFHDGSIMTASDVVTSFKRNPRFTGDIRAIGNNKVEVSFSDKRANFLESVTQLQYSIARVSSDGKIYGTGPFYVAVWNPESEVVLKAFKDYWDGGGELDGARFLCAVDSLEAVKKLKDGEVDVVDIVQPEFVDMLEGDKDITVSVLHGVNLCFVHLNVSRPPLDSAEFRRALNIAIDKENLIKDIYKGHAVKALSLIPRALGGSESPYGDYGFNISKAREIIKRYLHGQDRVFTMVGLPFPRPYCPNPQATSRLIAGYLRSAGIKIKYVPVHSFKDYDRYVMGDDFDFALSGWVMDSKDPDDFFTPIFGIGDVPAIFSHIWKSNEFESTILKARRVVSLKSRWAYYNTSTDLFFKASPWIMIASANQIGAYRNSIVGFKFSPTGELRLRGVSKIE